MNMAVNMCIAGINSIPPKTASKCLNGTVVSSNIVKHTFSQISGLRSMQHIKGTEREIIEAYRSELTHDIWGDAQKMKEWAENKFKKLAENNYVSDKLTKQDVETHRNEIVRAWAEELNNNYNSQNNPFLKLKVMKSVTSNLTKDNAQLPPPINPSVLDDTLCVIKKTGASFSKTYFKLLREFDSSLNVRIEEVCENGISGKWFSVTVPKEADAKRNLGLFSKIKDFISVLSQRTNWCTRTPNTVGKNYTNCDFHIFIDTKGNPQLCLVGSDSYGGWFRDIRGQDQYAPIKDKYKKLLKDFLIRHNLENAEFGGADTKRTPIMKAIDTLR